MADRTEIRTRARIRADQDNSTFPTDTQYNYFIDEAAKETWYDLIKAGWPINFSVVTSAFSSSFKALSAMGATGTPVFVRGVYYSVGQQFYQLKAMQEGDRAALMSTTGTTYPTHYDVRLDPSTGLGVEILPFVGNLSIRVEYVSEYPGFASDGTVWYGPARSDELIVLKAAMKGCRKEDNAAMAGQLAQEYEYVKQCVQDMASWANMRNPALIRVERDPLGRPRMPGDFDVYGPSY